MSSSPNLVFVFPDQHRIQSLGFWKRPEFAGLLRGGSDPVVTPNLDAFARDSLVLTRTTSTAPVCSPFRGMLFSGCYPERSGVPTNCGNDRPDCGLRTDLTTFTDVLAGAGYDCGYIGKYHLDFPHRFDESRPDWYPGGWDVYTPPERRHGCNFWHSYGTYDVHKDPHYWDNNGDRHDPKRWSVEHEADVACEFIRKHGIANHTSAKGKRVGSKASRKPFALFIAHNPPHTPNDSLRDCEEQDFRHYADKDLRELLNRPNVNWGLDRTNAAPYYFAQVTGVDRAFGRILKAIDEAGIRDHTIVVFTSDHGELLCSHAGESKNRIWSESFDIPFLLRYPGKVKAQTDDLLMTPVDMMPSLLGLMGFGCRVSGVRRQGMPDMDGTDYSGLWLSGQTPETLLRQGFLLRQGSGGQVAGQARHPASPRLRRASMKPSSVPFMRNQWGPKDGSGMHRGYVVAARGVKTHRHTLVFENLLEGNTTPELYDDDADPYQMHPLPLNENRALVDSLVEEMRRHGERMSDPWRPPQGGFRSEVQERKQEVDAGFTSGH